MSASTSIFAWKLPRDSSLRPADTPEFRLLCWATSGAALGAVVVGLVRVGGLPAHRLTEFALWALLVAAVDLGALQMWRNVYIGLDFPLLLTAAFLFGPLFGGLIALVASIDPRELSRKVSLRRALFNRAQICLSVMAAGAVFQAARPGIGHSGIMWIPASLGLLADVVVNFGFVIAAQRLTYKPPWRQIPRSFMTPGGAPSFFLVYVGYGLFALLFSLAYLHAGLWAFLSFLVPIALGREVLSQGKRLVESSESLEAGKKALARASSRIEDERRDERARIASSLHDDVLQALYNVTLHAQVVREDLRSGQLLALEEDVPSLVKVSDEASALLRRVVSDIRRSPLGRTGVKNTLQLLTTHLEDEGGISITKQFDFIEPGADLQLLMYQVAREALTNAVRHSKASAIRVSLFEDGDSFRLLVEDDGVGFSLKSELADHFGLVLMRERAEMAGGKLSVRSEPGKGTRVSASFPKFFNPTS